MVLLLSAIDIDITVFDENNVMLLMMMAVVDSGLHIERPI